MVATRTTSRDGGTLYERFRRLLPLRNLEFTVLKGHLLVEEQLQVFLEASCRHPGFLEDARLSFSQKARLTQALR